MSLKTEKTKKGFTILELLAAVVIIGIISLLVTMAISKYINQGKQTVDSALKEQLELMAKSYYSDNKSELIGNENVLWYATLQNKGYVTNELVDSSGNNCYKSYVTTKVKENGKYEYNGCVICDNGYNNTTNNASCNVDVNAIAPNCSFAGDSFIGGGDILRITLSCTGENLVTKVSNNNELFSLSNSSIGKIESITVKSDSEKEKVYEIDVQGLSNGGFDLILKPGVIENVVNNKGTPNYEVKHTISVDRQGPACELTGAYTNSNLTSVVDYAKSNVTVFYKLICTDSNGIKANSTISGNNFVSSNTSLLTNITIVNQSQTGNSFEALISAKTGTGNGLATILFNSNSLYDVFNNPNSTVNAKINGNDSFITIDNSAPTCTWTGPSSDTSVSNNKYYMYVDDSTNDYVYYKLTCTDNNKIIGEITNSSISNSGFSSFSIQTNLTSKSDTSHTYIIKAYEGTSLGSGYLTLLSSVLTDVAGNYNSSKTSASVTMRNTAVIPSCDIDVSYASDYSYATLTGTLTDSIGLSGYAWTDDYYTPSSFSSVSGTYSTKSKTIYENGWRYLHVKNTSGETDYCLAYIYQIKEPAPSIPTITASDYILSDNWHNSNFSLSASGSGSGVTYYWGTSASSQTLTSAPSITSETSGQYYYAKACRSNDSTNCSSPASYYAKLDKTDPTCGLYFRTGAYYDCDTGTGGTVYSSSQTATSDVYVTFCPKDSLSGIDSDSRTIIKGGKATELVKESKATSSTTYSASVSDNAGNSCSSDTKNVTIEVPLTCGDWSCTVTHPTTCTESGSSTGTSTKYVECTSGYKKKTTYTGSCSEYNYTYNWSNKGTETTSKSKGASSAATLIEYSLKPDKCTASKWSNYYYSGATCISCVKGGATYAPSCSNASNNGCNQYEYTKWYCSRTKGTCKTYGSYTPSTGYSTSCTSSGTKGTDKTYVTCDTGYFKRETCTRTCS